MAETDVGQTARHESRVFQPDFLGGGRDVSRGALELYWLLVRLERGARKRLATMLKITPRAVYNRLTELVQAGWIVKRRTNRSNLYYFTDDGPRARHSQIGRNFRSGSEVLPIRTGSKLPTSRPKRS